MSNEPGGWRLYSRTVNLNARVEKTVYFFSKRIPANGKPADPPVGYRIALSPATGMPLLERLET